MSDQLLLLPHPTLPDLESLASRMASKSGLELCSVHLFTHKSPITLQVQIRQIDGRDVTLEECADFSKPMGEAIDASELITDSYVLEVSSPGIGENLQSERDFTTFKGFPIEVLYSDKKKSEVLTSGLLLKRTKDHLHLNIQGRIKKIKCTEILSVTLISPTD